MVNKQWEEGETMKYYINDAEFERLNWHEQRNYLWCPSCEIYYHITSDHQCNNETIIVNLPTKQERLMLIKYVEDGDIKEKYCYSIKVHGNNFICEDVCEFFIIPTLNVVSIKDKNQQKERFNHGI